VNYTLCVRIIFLEHFRIKEWSVFLNSLSFLTSNNYECKKYLMLRPSVLYAFCWNMCSTYLFLLIWTSAPLTLDYIRNPLLYMQKYHTFYAFHLPAWPFWILKPHLFWEWWANRRRSPWLCSMSDWPQGTIISPCGVFFNLMEMETQLFSEKLSPVAIRTLYYVD